MTPSLEGLLTKAKEAPSPLEVRLAPLDANPVAQFLGLKWPISPNENFFSENLLMSLVSFIHAYLHAKNQIQIFIY